MATTTVDELAKLLAGKFDISDSLLKEVTNKAIGIANKKAEKTIKERFKEGGVFGLAKDFFTKNKPKEQDNKGILSSLKDLFEKNKPKEQDLIKDEQKPQKVLIDGITDTGYRDLAEKMPDILKGIFDKTKTKEYKEKTAADTSGGGLLSLLPKGITKLLGGALMAGGGIALLLGGVAALITGLNTDGPFKGLLKILSNVGIAGGLKLLEKGALNLVKNLKSFVNMPVKLFQTAYKGLRGIFGKGISKTITGALAKTPGLLTKMLGGLVKFITPLLKKIPLIGTLISFGFAYTRFKSGDVVGGIIDVLSGLVGLLSLTGVGAAVAIPIQIGLDVLNAFLDAKAGGATGEASQKKAGMIGNFFGKIYDFIGEKLSGAFNWVVEIGKKVLTGNWGEAFIEVAKLVPAMGWVVDLMGGEEAVATAGNTMGGQALDFYKGIKNYVFEKIGNALGWIGKVGTLYSEGKWGDLIKELAGTFPSLNWVLNLMGGEEAVVETANAAGGTTVNIFQKFKDTIFDKVSKIFGVWGDIGKKFKEDDVLGGIGLLCKNIPGLEWLGEILDSDATKMEFKENAKSGGVFSAIGGIFDQVSQKIKEQFLENALGVIPDPLLGFPVRAMIAQKLGLPVPPGTSTKNENFGSSAFAKATGYDEKTAAEAMMKSAEVNATQTPTPPETSSTETQTPETPPTPITQAKDIVIDENGGMVISSPKEGGLFQLSKNDGVVAAPFGDSGGSGIPILETIASNTATTNETIKNLSQAILQLAGIFDKKQTSSNNIIVNGQNQNQTQQYPTAAQVAATNVDPIRQIRMQFAV